MARIYYLLLRLTLEEVGLVIFCPQSSGINIVWYPYENLTDEVPL